MGIHVGTSSSGRQNFFQKAKNAWNDTYTKDDDRQSACACAVPPATNRALLRRPKLGRRDPASVARQVETAAAESRTEGKMFFHFRLAAANTICKLAMDRNL